MKKLFCENCGKEIHAEREVVMSTSHLKYSHLGCMPGAERYNPKTKKWEKIFSL